MGNGKLFDIKKTDDGIKLSVKVIPNACKCEIAGVAEKELKIRLDAPPVEGKANEKCIKFLAKTLKVSKSSVFIISGERSRSKILFINGNPEILEAGIINLITPAKF